MDVAWRSGLLLALALAAAGCAHRGGALASGAAPGPTPTAVGAPGAAASPDAAPAEPVAAKAAGPADDSALSEDDLLAYDTPHATVADPLAPWNRAMFTFNDRFYFWVLKPVAKGYRAVVPSLARTGVENFFDNLRTPLRFVSDVLQLKGREATIELGKFMINSTWGVLGFGNLFAGNPETNIPDNDLGLTLAHYGVGSGAYVVWPFLGSYTLRDTVGWIGGLGLDPVSYVSPVTVSLGGRTYYLVNYTSFRIGDYESLKNASVDPYLATRDAYLQYRAQQARE
jgi:phospholipid-binding lipoprotein MlaA